MIRKIRARRLADQPAIPAVAVTAFRGAEDRALALAAGFQRHLGKPVDETVLIAVVSKLARGIP